MKVLLTIPVGRPGRAFKGTAEAAWLRARIYIYIYIYICFTYMINRLINQSCIRGFGRRPDPLRSTRAVCSSRSRGVCSQPPGSPSLQCCACAPRAGFHAPGQCDMLHLARSKCQAVHGMCTSMPPSLSMFTSMSMTLSTFIPTYESLPLFPLTGPL